MFVHLAYARSNHEVIGKCVANSSFVKRSPVRMQNQKKILKEETLFVVYLC